MSRQSQHIELSSHVSLSIVQLHISDCIFLLCVEGFEGMESGLAPWHIYDGLLWSRIIGHCAGFSNQQDIFVWLSSGAMLAMLDQRQEAWFNCIRWWASFALVEKNGVRGVRKVKRTICWVLLLSSWGTALKNFCLKTKPKSAVMAWIKVAANSTGVQNYLNSLLIFSRIAYLKLWQKSS